MRPALIVAFLIAVGSARSTDAGAGAIFGPTDLVRKAGAPQDFHAEFSQRTSAPRYTLIVKNGTTQGSRRVSSARIWLNGAEVIGPRDLNQNVDRLLRSVQLDDQNKILVRLSGAPNGVLTVSIVAEVGPEGGTVTAFDGARLVVPAGSLRANASIDLAGRALADIPVAAPLGYEVVGAVDLLIQGAALQSEAQLAIRSNTPFRGRSIVARILDLDGSHQFVLSDTASLTADGFLETNSPPFPGVLTSGTYVFMVMPAGLGIMGIEVSLPTGRPAVDAFVRLIPAGFPAAADPLMVQQSISSLAAFVGTTDSTGLATVPGVLPNGQVEGFVVADAGAAGMKLDGFVHQPPSLPDILIGGFAGSWIKTVVASAFDVDRTSLPPNPAPCPCGPGEVLIVPPRIPPPIPMTGSDLPFLSGNTQELRALCGTANVTRRTDIPGRGFSLGLLTGGFSVNAPIYLVRPPGIVQVAVNEVTGKTEATAQTPGTATILFSTYITQLIRLGPMVFPRSCLASGVVDPVNVSAQLDVQLAGNGFGSIRFNPGGVECGPNCSAYPAGSLVEISADPVPGSTFVGWGAACSGASQTNTITLTLDEDLACTAIFALDQVVSYNSLAAFSSDAIATVQATFESFSIAPVNLGSSVAEGCVSVSFDPTSTPGSGTKGIAVLNAGSSLIPPPTSKVLSAHGNEDLTLTFSGGCSGRTAVGFETFTNGSAAPIVTVVDVEGSASVFTLNQPPNTHGFFGIVSIRPIVSVRWLASNGHLADTAIDNIRIGDRVP